MSSQGLIFSQTQKSWAATGVAKASTTNTEGRFVVPYLLPGEYRLVLEKAGFQRYEQRGITLDVQQNLSLEITLAIGDVNNTIQVSPYVGTARNPQMKPTL